MKRQDIHKILYPESIAVVGVSNHLLKGASMFLGAILNLGYEGKLYPVHPSEETIQGLECYPSLIDIPDRVDHVIIGVPAHITPDIIEHAIQKEVNSVHIFTAGFAEFGTQEGAALQKKIADMARGKVRIIGPNCMGLYNPEIKMTFDFSLPAITGDTGFLSQSGGLAVYFAQIGHQEKNYCSKVVSIGNSSDLKLTDFFEYLSGDDDTKNLCLYIEGLDKDEGAKFLEILKHTTPIKPVIIWKTGKTSAGANAAASHTGSMAGEYQFWQAISRQFGAVLVDSIDEMHDFIKIHRMTSAPKSNKSCIIAIGGGFSVAYTDTCVAGGLELPELQEKTQEDLLKYIPAMGTIRRNPVDLSGNTWTPGVMKNTLKTVGDDKHIDSVIFISDLTYVVKLSSQFGVDPNTVISSQVAEIAAARDDLDIPVLCVIPGNMDDLEVEKSRLFVKKELEDKNIPTFLTIERAIKALKRACEYQRFLELV